MPELNTTEHYKIAQSKFKCKIGDRVRVSHSCKKHENGWENSWVSEMDYCIGMIGTITNIDPTKGIRFKESMYRFPYFCLDIVR